MQNLFHNALLTSVRLNLTGNEEIVVGKQGSADVVIKKFDDFTLLCTKSYSGSVARYVPRGRNFWNWGGFTKNANATQENYNLINVSNSNYDGLENPLNASFVPIGWKKGSFAESDGNSSDYFYLPAVSTPTLSLTAQIDPATGLPMQWYNTTGGKVGIVSAALAFAAAIWYAFKKK